MSPREQEQEKRIEELKKKFPVGTKVRYIPLHAKGDKKHPDCEDGEVTGTNGVYVFVKYKKFASPAATDPESLIVVE